jgi:hypothetical protein
MSDTWLGEVNDNKVSISFPVLLIYNACLLLNSEVTFR